MDFFYLPFISKFVNDDDDKSKVNVQYEIVSNQLISNNDNQPRYKLTFFNGKGLAEMSRMILAYRGIDFIDNRLEYSEWLSNIHSISYQLVPILEFDGKMICQELTIARYLGRIYELSGKDPYEQAQVDSVVEILKDFADSIKPHIIPIIKEYNDFDLGFRDYRIRSSLAESLKGPIERYFPVIQAAAKNSTKYEHGFIFSSGLTYADFAVVSFCEIFEIFYPDILSRYHPIDILKVKVMSLPQLQHYLKTRPFTIF